MRIARSDEMSALRRIGFFFDREELQRECKKQEIASDGKASMHLRLLLLGQVRMRYKDHAIDTHRWWTCAAWKAS